MLEDFSIFRIHGRLQKSGDGRWKRRKRRASEQISIAEQLSNGNFLQVKANKLPSMR